MAKISVVVPAYNEEDNISLLADKIGQILKSRDFELVFIDDGSTDETRTAIKIQSSKDSRIRGISFSRNFGHQAALKAGLDYATGDCVISLDCDLEHPPELIEKMIDLWENGYEVVISRRLESNQLPLLKRIFSKYFYLLLNQISEVPIEQGSADFRLLDRKVVHACKLLRENDLFWRGIVPWLGFKSVVVPYEQGLRQSGVSKYSLSRMIRFSLSGVTSFSIKPLYISMGIGILFCGFAFFYLIYVIFVRLFTDATVSGWASMIATLLMISGIQLFMMGVIGVYLGKLFLQAKGRPTYVVRETIGDLSLS